MWYEKPWTNKFTDTSRYRELKKLYEAMCFAGQFDEAEKVFRKTIAEEKEFNKKVKQQGQ
jgi:hypothetical protein